MKRIFRFIKALIRYILFGNRVSFDDYRQRLFQCSFCKHLDYMNWTCKKCGCYVDKKAKMSTEECPLKMWAHIPENE